MVDPKMAFCLDKTDRERPIKFGFTPEEREWLKMLRPYEDIMAFIYDNDYRMLVTIAIMNSDTFRFAKLEGELVYKDGHYYFVGDPSEGNEEFEIPFENGEIDLTLDPQYYRFYAAKDLSSEDKDAYRFIIIYDEDEKDDGTLTETEEHELLKAFIEEMGICSYFLLGKAINAGMKNFNKWAKSVSLTHD